MIEIDAAWVAANPLPLPQGNTDKKSRGRLLVIGGSRRAPGAVRLTGEAALRAGAGRVRIATLEAFVPTIGAAFPEAGFVAMPEHEGEIAGDPPDLLPAQAAQHNAVALGPGMANQAAAARLIEQLAREPAQDTRLLLDAAAVACAGALGDVLKGYAGRLVLTPHEGEMAGLSGRSEEEIRAAPDRIALDMAKRFGAVIALKGVETFVATPAGTLMHYAGGGVGLATGGSGDVLAGVIGGLLARGIEPGLATARGVWMHGQAGRVLAASVAPIGFLARELIAELPRLA